MPGHQQLGLCLAPQPRLHHRATAGSRGWYRAGSARWLRLAMPVTVQCAPLSARLTSGPAAAPHGGPFSACRARVAAGRGATGPLRHRAVVARCGGTSGTEVTEAPTLADLRSGLQEAIKGEDYQSAARIRDRISELEQADPLVQAERKLEQAIAEERFEDAVELRDRLHQLRPPPQPAPATPAFDATTTTSSDLVTDGVRVTCRSFYVPAESTPARGAYFFGYQITITNESQDTLKLMERYWHIINGQGQSHEVRGQGVVGTQPELAPGESFKYQSACPLPTPKGTMEGHYEFYAQDKESGQWRRSFLVKIGMFELRADV